MDVVITREDTIVVLPQGSCCHIPFCLDCLVVRGSAVLVHDGTSGKLEMSV